MKQKKQRVESDEKIHENRVRRKATRQRLVLMKSRRRDPNAPDYGRYMLIDPEKDGMDAVVIGAEKFAYCATLDEVEAWLTT